MRAAEAVRCAEWTRAEGIDPVGSAGSWTGALVVEWPLPWPAGVVQIEELRAVVAACEDADLRLQLAHDPCGRESPARVTRWDRGPHGSFRHFVPTRVEEAADVVSAALGLARSASVPVAEGDTAAVEVLLCGHGSRDRCCGSLGVQLEKRLLEGQTGDGPRLWRTSHLGGHRFAPTAVVLPWGTTWSHLDAEILEGITRREHPVAEALVHYRGCLGIDDPAVQAVEREAFREIGWDWLDWERLGETRGRRARVCGRSPDGDVRTWEASVHRRPVRPAATCGQPLSESTAEDAEYVVAGLVSV